MMWQRCKGILFQRANVFVQLSLDLFFPILEDLAFRGKSVDVHDQLSKYRINLLPLYCIWRLGRNALDCPVDAAYSH